MAAPELRLNVSLDLGFFRQQLQKLSGIAASEFNAPLKVRFDRTTLNNEIRLLNRYVNNKTFNIKINTNLEAEINAADRLVQALQRVQQASGKTKNGLPVGVQGLSRTAGQGGVSATEIKALFSAAIQGGLLDEKTLGNTRAQMVAALGAIGRDSIEGLLNGLESGDAKLQKAAQFLGKSLITSFKEVLGIASPSREFRKIGDDAGKGFEQGLLKAMEIAERSATRQMQRMLDRLARMALMMGGMSASEISRQIQATKALPSLNWAATSPRNVTPISPSSSGRLLTGGPSMLGLPGTAFGGQKYLPTALGDELKKVLRDAANAFIDAVKQNIREVRVREVQNLLAPSRVAGLLSAGVGRAASPYAMGGESRAEMFARREREARVRSDLRAMDIMGGGGGRGAAPYSYAYRGARPLSAIVPYAAGGAIVPSGGGGGGAGPGGTGGGPGNFTGRGGGFSGGGFNVPNLPGTGLVREIGQEFAFATKQVLLFGTAYKALAFLTNFPAQVGQAVGQLQSFQNSLKAISPTAAEAATSNQFILDTVDRYNVPLQSARDGFIKLYASMQPAGFSGGEIRDLFLGISQAAASFGMSSDKVDRVQYAFAQMASKGQVMSEELKGQLGDVLPGAMAIFAEAAGFKGPDAITKFSKALEDGAFKGEAMKVLLTNVGIVMRKEFGPGAEGAARTFQGVINRMQNSLKLLYESFEPAAVGFLNAVVKPMTDGIRVAADAFNAFFTGQAARTAGGNALAQQLRELKPSFDGIANNLRQLVPTFELFGNILLGVAKAFTVIAGNPITGFLLKIYANVLLVNSVFTLLGGKILVGLIANINAAVGRFIALNFAVASLQRTSTVANSSLAGTQLQMGLLARSAGAAVGPVGLLRGALLGIARLGAIAVSISIAVYGFEVLAEARRQIDAIRGLRSKGGTAATLVGASREKVLESKNVARQTIKQATTELEKIKTLRAGMPIGGGSLYGTREATLKQRILDAQDILKMQTPSAQKAGAAPVSITGLGEIPGGGGGGRGTANKLDTYDRSQLDFIKQQGEQEQLALDRRRQQNVISETRYKIDSAALELEITRKEEAEKLRLATLATNKDNLSAQDKQLKLADLQTAYTNNLAIAQDKYNVAVEGARKELEGPFNDALKEANFEIMEQQMLLNNLQAGITELTPDQQAYLQVLKLTTGKSEDELALLQEQSNALRQILEQRIAINKQVGIETKIERLRGDIRRASPLGGLGLSAGFIGDSGAAYESLLEEGGSEQQAALFANLQDQLTLLETRNQAIQQSILGIGDAFGTAMTTGVASLVTGTASAKEVFASFLESVGKTLMQAAQQMIATYISIGIAKMFAGLGGGLQGGNAATAMATNPNVALYSAPLTFATGGIAPGGFKAFANGGMVTGPTLGLVGEGRYNEAIVPLPDGRSIPVQMRGASSAREAMQSPSGGRAMANAPISMKFETTKINGVEYVSREQLEQAMAATRKQAARDGASMGMGMTLDKIQNSPNTRSRIGIR